MTHWQPYKPNDAEPWDLRRVVHLHRRVVFGPAWSEIERDLKDDPQQAVSRVLNKECRQQCVPDDSLKLANLIGDSAALGERSDVSRPIQRATLRWTCREELSGNAVIRAAKSEDLRPAARLCVSVWYDV